MIITTWLEELDLEDQKGSFVLVGVEVLARGEKEGELVKVAGGSAVIKLAAAVLDYEDVPIKIGKIFNPEKLKEDGEDI